MVGRHVYRVHSDGERWVVSKDGEDQPRGDFANRDAAVAEAARLAAADEPSKITVMSAEGAIEEERSFGIDPGTAIEA